MKFAALPLFILACTPAILCTPSPIQAASNLIRSGPISAIKPGTLPRGPIVRDVVARDCPRPVVGTTTHDVSAWACPRNRDCVNPLYRGSFGGGEDIALECWTEENTDTIDGNKRWARLTAMGYYVPLAYVSTGDDFYECPPGQ